MSGKLRRVLRRATRPACGTPRQQLRKLLFSSWLNVLFVAVPAGFGLYYADSNPVPVFLVNLVAVVPCSRVLATLAEDLIRRTGPFVGATLYMTIQ